MTTSRAEILNALLPGLNELFGIEYKSYADMMTKTEYVKRSKYGKYSIYKWEYEGGYRKSSTTVARGLTRDEANGMMKLLKEPK